MRKWSVFIALVLVLSLAAVFVETAAISVWGRVNGPMVTYPKPPPWQLEVPANWPDAPSRYDAARGALFENELSMASVVGDNDQLTVFVVTEQRIGWPMRCGVTTVMSEGHEAPRVSYVWANLGPPSAWREGVEIPTWLRQQPGYGYSVLSRFPLRPLWPGLIANTLLHVLVFTALFVLPGWLLRARRRAKGACLACGYSLAGIAPGSACPECGAAR